MPFEIPLPDIDPATAAPDHAIGDTLRSYRADPRMDGALTFGMNAITQAGEGLVLKVGQAIGGNLSFD